VITSYSNQQLEGLKALRHKRGDPLEDDLFRFEIKPDENPIGEWTVYVNLLKIFLKMNRPDLFRRVSYTCWVSQLFSKNERMQKDLDLHCALASILCGDTEMTPHHLRTLVGRYNIPLVILNLLSLACRRCGHTRYGRTMVRLLMKHPNDTRLMTLSAHTSFMTGTYKYALMEYMALYKLRPEDPINPLMIATTLLHIAAQKQTGNRSQLMVQAVAFITRYAQIRGECQETYYNLGRFYHFQGLFNQAIMYYKKVLMTDPIDDVVGSDMTGNISDLKREAAFNLAQIYSASNCWEIARQYLHRYITV
jgi:general transcription factor 3C polypeptide 3 (transcription factor C subunit 4)